MTSLARRIEAISDDVIAWRRELHRHPELSHEEKRTSEWVHRILRDEIGLADIRTGVGGYGIVAEIDTGRPGPAIGLRADMDALPIQESVPCDFASRNPGVMHACGHDAHTAMLLGAARVLKELADGGELGGKVRFIFQPAEEALNREGKSGGRMMVEEGVMEGLSMVAGQHVSPAIEAGKMSFQRGSITASSDSFEITIHGQSAHGATPQHGVDAIVISAAVVQGIQQIISRRIAPVETGLITVGTIRGGTARNIIAPEVELAGTIRAFDPAVRAKLIEELGQICGIADAMGGRAQLRIIEGYPPGFNDPAMADLAEAAVREALGDGAIHPPIGPSTGAEDFAFMSRIVPGVFMRLGVKDPCWPAPLTAHKPDFQIDERSLAIGTTALVAFAVKALREPANA
ncbi:MAG TPA: M20 family metallopeptidase [Chthoniobacteraceae bacterium]|nr:M20 family metallopeptidase [Chthoniobacteraceae bacterium]